MDERLTAVVVTADDDAREPIVRSLTRAGILTVPVVSGEEALATIRGRAASLVVIDVELPTMSGYETCHELREEFGEELPIIFVSGIRTEPVDRVAGLLIGADDYLLKPVDQDELLVRARRLLRRSPAMPRNGQDPLTDREMEILRLLASGASQARIAGQLRISPKTVGTHIQRILTKLGVHSRTEAVAFAFRHGWVPSGDTGEPA